MIKKRIACIVAISAMLLCSTMAVAQRRSRPGSMKHTNAEVVEKQKITKLNCKYIRDGVTFSGPVSLVAEGGMMPIGNAKLTFGGGRYKFSFVNAEFQVNKYSAMTQKERLQKGISKYEYDNSYESKKLGQDFDYGGKYATIEQYGKKWLILYNGNTDEVYNKIPLDGVNDSSIVITDGELQIELSCRN